MPVYQAAAGGLLVIDVPTDPARLEIHEHQVATGALVEVDPDLVEEYEDGPGRKLRFKAAADADADVVADAPAKPKGKAKGKAAAADDVPAADDAPADDDADASPLDTGV
jgi:hypothetical protein